MKRITLLLGCLILGFAQAAHACKTPAQGEVGYCAPNIQLESTDGRLFDLQKQRGKVVVVNFWATWCEPCIEELPSLEKLFQDQLANVEFVSVSIDSNQAALDRFFKINPGTKVSFPILKDFDKKTADAWGTFKVPETFIIDKEGEIRAKVIGVRNWQDDITIKYIELLAKQ